jgi:SdrD B-like domain
MSVFKNKFFYLVVVFAILGLVVSSLSNFNLLARIADAAVVNACSTVETLEGGNCSYTKVAQPQYEIKCGIGYTQMDAVCAKFNQQACTSFTQGLSAETGLCKLDLSSPVYGAEISDNDGRQCNGVGTNFKRYSVGLDRANTSGPVVCGNNFSLLDKSTFRFLPRVVTEISNLASIQTDSTFPACPTGYTELSPNKCSRPAVAQKCSVGGETFVNNDCLPCPAGQYCPVDGVISKTVTVCANGGLLQNNLCLAPVKYSTISYSDGCSNEYVKKDQSCAVVETRTHDTGCSYFYTSEYANVTAVLGSDGYCSTGGRSDFDSASITRVSDFNCNGVGTYYYNYNVAFDPLVCGNDYNAVGKTGFKWLPLTFTKITALQKIPFSTYICPPGWTSFDSSNNCSQAPIVQEYRHPVDCPINTYCPGGNVNPINCHAGSTSPARSTKLADCVYSACTNGATNPPSCNQCPAGLQLINGICLSICPAGVSRDANNNCTICVNGAANPSSGCNTCPGGFQFNGVSCVAIVKIVCKNGFELSNNTCICPSPKVVTDKLVNVAGTYQAFCETAASSSSSSVSSSIKSSSSSLISSSSISSILFSSSSSSLSSASLPVSISGYVYVDVNNNGIFESNESPIGGVTITLTGSQESCKNLNVSTTTNASGFYQFNNLAPCTYSLTQTQPTNYNSGITSAGTVNGVVVGNVNVTNKIDNAVLKSGQNSINNNFGELLVNLPANNAGTTIINNNNNPVSNNNNSVTNNITNNNPAPAVVQVVKPQIIPMAAPANSVTYYSSPVATVTETIRSGGFNIVLIITTLIAAASFGLIYVRGKRNQGFDNYTSSNKIEG